MNRIQIVTIREMLEQGKRMELPMAAQVVKIAPDMKQHAFPASAGYLLF